MKMNSLVQHKVLGRGRVFGFTVYPESHTIVTVDFGHSVLNVNSSSLTILFSGDAV